MNQAATQGYVLAHGEGQAIWAMGERITLKATHAQTNGAFTVMEDLAAPGGEPPPHFHENEDEAYYILDGEMMVGIGDQQFYAGVGSFVFLPRNVPHRWQVLGGKPVRFLVFFTPGGVEDFFLRLSQPALANTPPPPPPGPPNIEQIVQTAGMYGIRLAGPPPSL